MRPALINIILFSLLTFSSCSSGFDPIDYGHDACAECKMTIMDERYAAEILTKKGKTYKFDDISCLIKHIKQENFQQEEITVYVADFMTPGGKFLDARQVVYLHNEMFKSPMNGHFAAFASAEHAGSIKDSLRTDILKWENLAQ